MGIDIFGAGSITPVKDGLVGIREKATVKRGSSLFTVPLTNLRIDRANDLNITRTLNNSYVVSTFGEAPVTITLTGVGFPEDTKLSAYLASEVTGTAGVPGDQMGLSMEEWSVTAYGEEYVCMLMAVTLMTPHDGSSPVYSIYNITLKGIRK